MKNNAWCDRGLTFLHLCYRLCTTEKQFHRELKKLKLPRDIWPTFIKNEWSNATVHIFSKSESNEECAIVCIKGWENKDPIAVAGLLVHEAIHLFQEYKENIGETYPSKEFEAYAIQHISQNLMWQFKEQTQ
jgi:hypothetical protein